MASSQVCATPDPDPESAFGRYPRFRPGDLFLVAAALAVAALFAFGHGKGNAGDLTVGSPAGEILLPLSSDTTLEVEGRLGLVSIQIADGKARIACSPCPGQQCVDQGWISSPGDVSVCAPSAVWIRVEGDSGEPDAVSY